MNLQSACLRLGVSKAMEDAKKASARLFDRIDQVLSQNEAMMRRLRAFDEPEVDNPLSTLDHRSQDSSSTTSGPKETDFRPEPDSMAQRKAVGFAFEEELLASIVYKRPLFSQSGSSLVTSSTRSTSVSILSSLSISDVSNISILAVPIYANEISNSQRYTFGDFNPKSPKPPESSIASKARRWDSFADLVRKRRLQKAAANASKTEQNEPVVFGVALGTSIKFANVAISLVDEEGNSFIYGYIPIVIAKVGVFLKEKGMCFAVILIIS